MKCRTAGCGYFNSIDGTGWPDYVMVENDGEVFKGTYDVREYFPVDIRALLALADEMEEFGNLPVKHPGIRVLHNDDFSRELGYARRIREALGASE